MKEKLILAIDPVSRCNLRCVSCPNGNSEHRKTNAFAISVEKFEKIISKLKSEMEEKTDLVIWLYNWSEPLLHPQIDRLIDISKKYSDWVGISTNLNFTNTDIIKKTITAEPSAIKVSISGFTQKTYEKNHVGGNLELVKSNLIYLSQLRTMMNSQTKIWIGYHVYNDNMGEQYDRLKSFCMEHGINLEPYPAFLSPIERLLERFEGKRNDAIESVINKLLFTPDEWVQAVKKLDVSDYCSQLEEIIPIDPDGFVQQCCRTYNTGGGIDFLSTPLRSIQESRRQNAICKLCRKWRLHIYGDLSLVPEFADRLNRYL